MDGDTVMVFTNRIGGRIALSDFDVWDFNSCTVTFVGLEKPMRMTIDGRSSVSSTRMVMRGSAQGEAMLIVDVPTGYW